MASRPLSVLETPEALAGESSAASAFFAAARVVLDREPLGLILDLTHTATIDAAAAEALIDLENYAAILGGVVLLLNVADDVMESLRDAGVDQTCYVRRADRAAQAIREARRTRRGDHPRATKRPSMRRAHLRLLSDRVDRTVDA